MKKLAALAAIALLGYLAYARLANPPRSPDESEYRRIAKAFNTAIDRYGQANRMTADIGDIAAAVEGLKQELAALEERVSDGDLLAKVRGLDERMERFLSDKR